MIDVEDKSLLDTLAKKFEGQHPKMIFTDCPQNSHSKWALLCKTYWEFQEFLRQPSTQVSPLFAFPNVFVFESLNF